MRAILRYSVIHPAKEEGRPVFVAMKTGAWMKTASNRQ
jgi:hypothetical protein